MPPPVKQRRSQATVFLTVASLLSMTVLLGGMALPAFDPRPSLRWRVGDDLRKVPQLTELASGTALHLELDLPFPAFVYVASWSQVQGTIALFPSERLTGAPSNPVPAGTTAFPGQLDDKPMNWPTHAVVGPIYYLVVVSRERLADLEAAQRRVRQMGHMTRASGIPIDQSMYLFAPTQGMRAAPPSDRPADPVLEAAMKTLTSTRADSDGRLRPVPGHDGVFARVFVVQGR